METAATREDLMKAFATINRKIDSLNPKARRFITRVQAIDEIGRGNVFYAEVKGYINPIKGPGRNAKVFYERSEYEAFITIMKK